MNRGRIPEEKLDDRTWQELVEQAKSLIPHYAPEWTDLGPSDLGITLIELFAWLVEGLTYRLNRVPDRNYAVMLNLLGVTRDPGRPATVRLVFTTLADACGTMTIEKDSRFGTLPTSADRAIVFETDHELKLTPANLVAAYYQGPTDNAPRDVTRNLVSGPLTGLECALPDRGKKAFLFLAFDADPSRDIIDAPSRDMRLFVGLANAASLFPADTSASFTATWEHSISGDSKWKALTVGSGDDGTLGMRRSGYVRLVVRDAWDKRGAGDMVAGLPDGVPAKGKEWWWLKLTVSPKTAPALPETAPALPETAPALLQLESVLVNSVSATHAVRVNNETLVDEDGQQETNGRPWQRFYFKNRPIYRKPNARTAQFDVEITVNERDINNTKRDVKWQLVDDFPPGGSRCFRLDPVTGTLMLGSYDDQKNPTGAGMIPPIGSTIQATYRAVAGGTEGNVPYGAVRLFVDPVRLDGVAAVTNPGPARGGVDEESIEEAKRRAPEMLRSRGRAVTAEDYEYLAKEASTLVAKARALPTRDDWRVWEKANKMQRYPGAVNVLIVPNLPHSDKPTPSAELIEEVALYLSTRRPVGAHVFVRAPVFREIRLTVSVKVFRTIAENSSFFSRLEDDLRRTASRYLHPLIGGADGTGWKIGQDLLVPELFAQLQAMIGSEGFINTLEARIEPKRPELEDDLLGKARSNLFVPMLEYELLCGAKDKEHTIDFKELSR